MIENSFSAAKDKMTELGSKAGEMAKDAVNTVKEKL
jgi:hypothetical protein